MAADKTIWVALADRGGAYAEAAAVLREEVGREFRGVEFVVAPWQELPAQPAQLPHLVVALGVGALRGMLERASATPVWARVPVLAALLPRAGYESWVAKTNPPMTAVFLDQPVERYLDLLRLSMPERKRVGVVWGPDSVALRPALNKAAVARGLQVVQATVGDGASDLYPTLRSVLQDADVFLALPDPLVFHAANLQNILIAVYRQRVPMLSYAAGHVKAGATLALYASPVDAARQAAHAVRTWLAGRPLPPPRLSEGFSVMVNPQVTRSLGLSLDEPATLIDGVRRMEEGK